MGFLNNRNPRFGSRYFSSHMGQRHNYSTICLSHTNTCAVRVNRKSKLGKKEEVLVFIPQSSVLGVSEWVTMSFLFSPHNGHPVILVGLKEF